MSIGSLVTFQDYEGVEGFGMASAQDLANLSKALQSGQATARPGTVVPGDGYTLKPESLDRTLKNLTHRAEHFVAWKAWDKVPAYNTVEEYSQLQKYGSGNAAFIEEGELPTEDDATYARQFDVVKYMGTTRRVTHVMQTVRTHIGNVVAQETINGTMWLLEQVERALFNGNAANVPQEFDGLFTILERDASSENVIDMRGQPLSQQAVNEGAHIVRAEPNFGMATDLYMGDGAYSDLSNDLFGNQRVMLGANPQNGYDGFLGNEVKGMRTQAGKILFNPDVFITSGRIPVALGVGDTSKRPAAPTLGASTTPANAASQFVAADVGDYRFYVAARNRFGISAPVAVDSGAAITIVAGDDIRFTITPGGGPAPTCWVVYRSTLDGAIGTAVEMVQVPYAGTGATTFVDINANIPGTTKAALIQGNRENLVIKQLAPYTRIPLATIDTSTRWAQILYMVLTIHSPNKNILYKNVGRTAGTFSPSI